MTSYGLGVIEKKKKKNQNGAFSLRFSVWKGYKFILKGLKIL